MVVQLDFVAASLPRHMAAQSRLYVELYYLSPVSSQPGRFSWLGLPARDDFRGRASSP